MNYIRTGLLLAGLTGLFMAVGYLIGGSSGMVIALAVAAAINFYAYWNGDKLVLRMHGARQVSRAEAPVLHGIVEELAQRARLPMPRVYLIDDPQPNAFATGRNPENAAVAATTGLLDRLSREEVAAVMAHELAHVLNRDMLTMTITATIAGAISMLANFAFFFGGNRDSNGNSNPLTAIAVMILAPLGAMLVQMAISRSREYEADRIGAAICGQPLWLASALARLHSDAAAIPNRRAEANPATAHLFIVNPLHGQRMDSLFSTHPAMANRIARLQAMAGAGQSGNGGNRSSAASVAGSGGNRPWQRAGQRRRGPWN